MADKQNFSRRVPVSKKYLSTRFQALHLSPSNFTQHMKTSTVYGVIVDMPMAPTVLTTLACYINGAANLYFSNGRDYSGAAQRYPGVVQAARVFVANAANYIENLKPVTNFELPAGSVHYAYILTTGGVYRLELDSSTSVGTPEERIFKNLYHRLMNELRGAQLKDQAAGIDPSAAVQK